MSFSPVCLSEGVRYTHVETNRGKTDSLCVSFRVPLDPVSLAAVTLISKILIRGTMSFPDTVSICRECEDNYGCSVDIAHDRRGREISLTFMLSYLRNSFAFSGEDIAERAVKLLSEFIFSPYLIDGAFNAEYTEREKTALCALISSIKNSKPSYALYRANALMCPGEPIAVSLYDSADTVRSLTPEYLASFFADVVKTAPVDIVYAGNADVNRMLELVNEHLKFSPRAVCKPSPVRRRTPGQVRTFVEEASASQSTLVMGFRLGGDFNRKDFNDLVLFETVLSLSPVSKLFTNVREKLSLCYYCSSNIDRHNKIMYINAGIDYANSKKAQKAILKQIKDISDGMISAEEFDNAISFNVIANKAICDDASSLSQFYLSQVLRGVYLTPEDECDLFKKKGVKGLIRVAKRISLDTVYILKGNFDANNQKEL